MRVGILSLQHEANSFLKQATTLEDFRRDVLLTGESMRTEYGAAHHEVGGFFQGLEEAGLEALPLFMAWALPGGVLDSASADELLRLLLEALDAAGPLDGLLVAPHGAAVSATQRDLDGYWLSRVREKVGAHLPIVCTLDLHANLSPAMVNACDATIVYRTNPHLDQRERGLEAARLMARTLRGAVKPVQAAAFPPVAINIERQFTAASPCLELNRLADELRARPGVLSVSIVLGFPYADVAEMGAAFIVVTDHDRELAQALAGELERYLLEHRREFVGRLIGLEEALDLLERSPKPVCLLDMGDNVGGGAPGDGTWIAQALHRRGGTRALLCLFDPESVQRALEAGAGQRVELRIGGKCDALHGSPLELPVRVRGLYDGKFVELAPRHGGKTRYDMGQTAVVETNSGLTLMLTSRRTAPFSAGSLGACGLDPQAFAAIVAKGVHAPVAAYEPICKTFIRVNTPGVTTADMTTLKYTFRRRPLFPFEDL